MTKGFQSGYVALASVLVIGAVVTVIAISSALLAISESQAALADKKGQESMFLAESCLEELLLQMYLDENFMATSIVLPEGECATSISKNGSIWTISAQAVVDGYAQTVQVVADRSAPAINISDWRQI